MLKTFKAQWWNVLGTKNVKYWNGIPFVKNVANCIQITFCGEISNFKLLPTQDS